MIDSVRLNCYFIEETQLNKCKVLINTKVCKVTRPIYSLYSHQTCEIYFFLYPKTIPTICNRNIFKLIYSIWHTLHKKNSWLYTVQNQEHVTIKCNNKTVTEYVISDSGIFNLAEGCKAYDPHFILTFVNQIYDSFNVDFIPALNISVNCCNHLDYLIQNNSSVILEH